VLCVVGVLGVTQLHDVVYIVCFMCSTILRFNATTHQRLTDINVVDTNVGDIRLPWDIVACEQTSQLYVTDFGGKSVCRMSADGADIQHWWSDFSSDVCQRFQPRTLSVTSTGLLMTSDRTKQLLQLDAGGDELRRVQLPDDMTPRHAVESPTGTFIISHDNTQLWQCRVSEVNTDGKVLRQFTGSRLSSLGWTHHVAIDSHGNIFLADNRNGQILLLDAHLKLRRVIVDRHQLTYKRPYRLCYREPTGQLLVGLGNQYSVLVFDVLHR